jgi:hypothetical protein
MRQKENTRQLGSVPARAAIADQRPLAGPPAGRQGGTLNHFVMDIYGWIAGRFRRDGIR